MFGLMGWFDLYVLAGIIVYVRYESFDFWDFLSRIYYLLKWPKVLYDRYKNKDTGPGLEKYKK